MISAAKIPPMVWVTTAPTARFIPLPRPLLSIAILMCLVVAPPASAQDASNWDGQAHSAARLIAGAMSKNHEFAFLRAGIEIKLDPGWQTYWRDPGDSGAPPTFDFWFRKRQKGGRAVACAGAISRRRRRQFDRLSQPRGSAAPCRSVGNHKAIGAAAQA